MRGCSKPVPATYGQLDPVTVVFGGSIAVVGDYPTAEEAKVGRPFVGTSGDLLDKAFKYAGLRRAETFLTHAVLCAPPGGKLSQFWEKAVRDHKRKTKEAALEGLPGPPPLRDPVSCCLPRLKNQLGMTNRIVTMGKHAIHALSQAKASVSALRGGMMELSETDTDPARNILPTYSPMFVTQQARWTATFMNDFLKAHRWFRGVIKWQPPEITLTPTPEQLETFLASSDRFTFDLETDAIECLDANIRCVGIGYANKAMVVPFLGKDGFTRFYSQEDERRIREALIYVFANPKITKVGHNAGYYDKIVLRERWGVTTYPIIDTMLLHKSVASELPHSLAYVGSVYTEAPSWKTDREGRKLAFDAESDEQLHIYCGNDVDVTAKVEAPLWAEVQTRGQEIPFRVDSAMQAICADMHTVGMYVDQNIRHATELKLLSRRHELLTAIQKQLGRPKFNPASVLQMRDLLFDEWAIVPPLEEKERYTGSGDPSTADLVLRTLLTDASIPKERRDFIKLVRYYRKVQKVLGTYVVKLRPSNLRASPGDDLGWDEEDPDNNDSQFLRALGWAADAAWLTPDLRDKYGEDRIGIVNPRTGRMYPGYNAHVANCVVADTWLLSSRGLCQIGRVPGFGPAGTERETSLVLHDGDQFEQVSHLQNPGVQPTRRVRLVLGVELTGTPHHRVIAVPEGTRFSRQDSTGKWHHKQPANPDWARLDALAPGAYVKVPIGMDIWGDETTLPAVVKREAKTNANEAWLPATVDEDLALFVGAYNADGSLHDSNGSFSIRLSDTTAKPEMEEVYEATLRLFGSDAVRRNREGVAVTSIALASWAEALGLGRRFENKTTPDWICSAPKNVVLAYIRGLSLDSNITVNGGTTWVWHYTGPEAIVRSLQMFFFNLGIPAGVGDKRTPRGPHSWGLTVCGEDVKQVVAITGQALPDRKEGKGDQARPKYIRRGNTLWLRCTSVENAGLQQVYDVTIPTTHQFWANGTVSHNTGRLSSSKPINAQNFPKELRGMVVAQNGNVLVGADMDQLELRIGAARWRVELYLRAFAEGKDPHSMTAYGVFGEAFLLAAGLTAEQFVRPGPFVSPCYIDGKFEGKGDAKKMRDLAKAVQYASQYMAQEEMVAKLIQKTEVPAKNPDGTPRDDGTTDLPFALMGIPKVREMRDNWLKAAPEYEKGWNAEIEHYRKFGFVREEITLRRRDFLDGEAPNEIVNFPIQSSAAALMNRALIQLHQEIPLHKWGPGTGILNQCHDSIVVECPASEADWVAARLEACMNQTHSALPRVTITATAGIGHSWKEVG